MITDNRKETQAPKPPAQKTVIVNNRLGPTIIHLPLESGQIQAVSLSPGRNTPETLAEQELNKNPIKKQAERAAARMGERMNQAAAVLKERHPAYLEGTRAEPAKLEVR